MAEPAGEPACDKRLLVGAKTNVATAVDQIGQKRVSPLGEDGICIHHGRGGRTNALNVILGHETIFRR